MIYVFAILTVLFSVVCIFSFLYVKKKKSACIFAFCISVLAVIGAVVGAVTVAVFSNGVTAGSFAQDFCEWAKDTYYSYAKGAYIIAAASVVTVSAASFVHPKHRYVRASFTALSCILQTVASHVFSYISSNSTLSLTNYILLTGLSASLMTLLPLLFDYLRIIKSANSNGKSSTKTSGRKRNSKR